MRSIVEEAGPITDEDLAREWHRRAERDGLARVMRASQSRVLNTRVTALTRRLVGDYLGVVAAELGQPVRSALEIGCGVGRLTPTLARHAGQVTAVDMTPRMLDEARASCAFLSNVEFMLAWAEQIPWRAKRFDVSVSVWTLMHVLDQDRLAKICRALATSSRYLVLIEYEHAGVAASRWCRVRSLEEYLALLPGSRLVARRGLDYGGDRSAAALIGFAEQGAL
ncbi:class I SAM-dependent methyltransferase [Amycolatopsis nigrescens]|uniref:class I SAM-dependent methyltransferase n=1 Tax=Amycolatopsis nigrescens TaxID=381445 RepID=UPI0003A0D522|nr:class I SAM-dependent methyltransferase [Amycolatopsis nigrescens]